MTEESRSAGLPIRHPEFERRVTDHDPVDSLVAVRRDEVAALATAHRRARLAPAWGLVPFPGGLGAATALFALSESLGWAAGVWPLPLAGGAVVFLTLAGLLSQWERRRLSPFTFACLQCGAPILSKAGAAREDTWVELVLTTGCCPACGARIAVP